MKRETARRSVIKTKHEGFSYQETTPRVLVGILVGSFPDDFSGDKDGAAELALAELERRKIKIRDIAALAGETIAVALLAKLPLTTDQLIDALTLPFPAAKAAWERIESERISDIDVGKARRIMTQTLMLPMALRERIRGKMVKILRAVA